MRKPCCEKEGTNKGAWSKQEDQKLIDYIKAHGEGCWRSLPQAAGLHRCGKSCRLRWINYLRPDIKRGNFEQDEEDLIVKLHALLGNRWSLIAGRLPGRTDNEVKNYWNSHIRKKLMKMGIDPKNHRLNQIIPRCPQNDDAPLAASTRSGSSSMNNNINDAAGCTKNVDVTPASIKSSSGASSDLNLDLTIAFPVEEGRLHQNQNKTPTCFEKSMATEMETNLVSNPTLVLFR